jgi:hypothetical protein
MIKEVDPVVSMLATVRTGVGVGTARAYKIDNVTFHHEVRTTDIMGGRLRHHLKMVTTDLSHTIPMAHLLLIIEEAVVHTIVPMKDMTDMTRAIIVLEIEVPMMIGTAKDQVEERKMNRTTTDMAALVEEVISDGIPVNHHHPVE